MLSYRHIACLLALISLVTCAHASETAVTVRPQAQTLFIALDGVPYRVMAELIEEGHFWHFADPTRVIATFPSVSASGFGGIMAPLGIETPPGYDDEFYSPQENRIRGALLSPHKVDSNSFQGQFSLYRSSTLALIEMYTFPGMTGYNDLKTTKRLIWKYPDPTYYMVYIGGTDGAGHVLGRKRLKHMLVFMDEYLQRISRDYQKTFNRRLNIVLFSDHGFSFIRPKGISHGMLAKYLRHHGYYLKNHLNNDGDVVSVVLGNVSAAPFYVAPQHIPDLAALLSRFQGIDIVAYKHGNKIIVLANRPDSVERAEISWQGDGQRFRYHPLDGDPLNYRPVVTKLKNEGLLDRAGYADSQVWFRATVYQYYPDALYRLYHAFHDLVQNPAPILISTAEGYEIGDTWTRVGAWMRGGLEGTHGGLFRSTTEAFVMTNNPQIQLPPRLRYNEWFPYFFPTE